MTLREIYSSVLSSATSSVGAFVSSPLMSILQPVNLAASLTFCTPQGGNTFI
jgi:hypothetical protein